MKEARYETIRRMVREFGEIAKLSEEYGRAMKEAIKKKDKKETEAIAVRALEDFKARLLPLHKALYGKANRDIRETKLVERDCLWEATWNSYASLLKYTLPEEMEKVLERTHSFLKKGWLEYAEQEAEKGYFIFLKKVIAMHNTVNAERTDSIYYWKK